MTTDSVLIRLWSIANEFAKEYLCEHLNGKGGIFYSGERPIAPNQSSYNEDVVVAVPVGSGSDVQSGTCIVNVYINDIIGAQSGSYYQDRRRSAVIGELLEDKFVSYANEHERGKSELFFSSTGGDMVVTLAEPTTHQHFVSLKMTFKVLCHPSH